MTRSSPVNARAAGYGLALVLGLAVAFMGFSSSYATLSTYGDAHGFAFDGRVLPIGLDLGIPALLLLDWLRPSVFLRASAWSLTALTIAANGAVAGDSWPERLLHAVMPAVAIVIVESARHLRDDPSRMDKIRLSRWLLSPIRTARLRRRMVLWEITSYSDALTRESAILHARTVLTALHDRRYWWKTRRLVPATLLHQISTGQLPSSVLSSYDLQTAVREWVLDTLDSIAVARQPVTPVTAPTETDRIQDEPETEPDPWVSIRVGQDRIRPDTVPPGLFAAAIGFAEHHYAQVGKVPTVETIRTSLGTGQPRAQAIRKAIQSALDDPSVLADEPHDPDTAAETEPPAEPDPVQPAPDFTVTHQTAPTAEPAAAAV